VIFLQLEVVEQEGAAGAYCDFGSASQHFFWEGGRMGAMCNDSKKGSKALNREIRQIRERGARRRCAMAGQATRLGQRRRGGKSSGLIRVVPT